MVTTADACVAVRSSPAQERAAQSPDSPAEWFSRHLAIEQLIRQYFGGRRFGFESAADLDDLIQETHLKLLAIDRGELAAIRTWPAYVVRVARNVALDCMRHRAVLSVSYVPDVEKLIRSEYGAPSLEETINAQQELEWLDKLAQTLPPQCRQVLTLRKVYGLAGKEVARRLGISENTVEAHLAKAVRRLAARRSRVLFGRARRFAFRLRPQARPDA
jgi:RNA polymerase sigma factor (sigma-70 family)